MDGVTIISEVIYQEIDLPHMITCIAWMVLAVVFIVYNVSKLWRRVGRYEKLMLVMALILTFSVIAHIGVSTFNSYNKTHTEYEVIIDNTVGVNEFREFYEIISQDGDIYKVREKLDVE